MNRFVLVEVKMANCVTLSQISLANAIELIGTKCDLIVVTKRDNPTNGYYDKFYDYDDVIMSSSATIVRDARYHMHTIESLLACLPDGCDL